MDPGKIEIPNNGKNDDCNAATADVVPGADGDLDGFSINGGDCNDNDISIYPGAVDICGDEIDQDCNGSDPVCPLPTAWYLDSDGDSYGNPVGSIQSVTQPAGYVADNTDCDDGNIKIYPGAIEACGDGIDQNCSGNDFTCSSTAVLVLTGGSDEIITLDSPIGTTINNSQAIGNPSPPDTPPGATFPYGFISFSIDGVAPDGSTTMTITLPDGAKPDTYYKYGPTPDNTVSHWYEFMFDGETGAEINDNIITLSFVNGKRGDADLNSLNTTIADPGGPAITDQASLSADNDGSSGGSSSKCFIGSLSY